MSVPICKDCKYYKPFPIIGWMYGLLTTNTMIEPSCSHPTPRDQKTVKKTVITDLVTGKQTQQIQQTETETLLCSIHRDTPPYTYTVRPYIDITIDNSKRYCTSNGTWFEPRKTFWMKKKGEK